MTVNKSQGRTLKKVVLCLSFRGKNNKNVDLEDLYVALSRVREGIDIRLFLHGAEDKDKWESILYLTALKHNASVSAYFEGFCREKRHGNENWQIEERFEWQSHSCFQRLMGYTSVTDLPCPDIDKQDDHCW